MEQFLSEHPAVGYVTIALLFGVIGWLIKLAVSNSFSEVKELKKRMDEMEFNYKDEFKRVREDNKREFQIVRVDAQEEFKKIRQDSNDKHLEILGILTEVRIEIAELKGSSNHNK